MKRFLTVVLCLLLATMVFTACSTPAPQATPTEEPADTAGGGQSVQAEESSESSVDDIKAAGKLVMLTNAEFPPYEYLGEGSEVVGIDVDICQKIADELGVELEVVNMDFDGLIPALSGGKGDLVAARLTVDPERAESVDFSEPYADAKQLIIVNADDPKVASEDDLAGKTVGVQLGTTGDLYMTDLGTADVKPYKSGLDAAMDLKNGKLDCVVIDKLPAESIVDSNEGLAIVDMESTDEQYAIAVQKGDAGLLQVVDKVVAQLLSDGYIAESTAAHVEAFKAGL